MFIFSNSGHLGWKTGLSDTILRGKHTRTIMTKIVLIVYSGLRGDLNVKKL